MNKKVGVILVLAAIAMIAWIAIVIFKIGFWVSEPSEKFAQAWSEDIRLLEASGSLPKQWKDVKEIAVRSDNSPVQDWLVNVKPPIAKNEKGKYRLDVFFIHWIEQYRYGVVVQYNIVDLANQNTIWELGRTHRLGIVY